MDGDELKEWRERRGMSRDTLAKKLGVPDETVRNWERGRNKTNPLLPLALKAIRQK